jgi:hypothetical protein
MHGSSLCWRRRHGGVSEAATTTTRQAMSLDNFNGQPCDNKVQTRMNSPKHQRAQIRLLDQTPPSGATPSSLLLSTYLGYEQYFVTETKPYTNTEVYLMLNIISYC